MQFHIDQDTGDLIRGWIIYDNPTTVPVLAVRLPDGSEIVFEANEHRSDMRDLGRHTTGQCGFSIGRPQLGDNCTSRGLTIYDHESGMLVYRRTEPGIHAAEKIFFFEPSALSIHRLFLSCSRFFALPYEFTQGFSFELMYSFLSGKYSNSILLFGHASCVRYQPIAISENFRPVALLRHPMEELAERLLCAKHLATGQSRSGTSLATTLAELVPYVEDINLRDSRALAGLMRRLRVEHPLPVTNPLTRALGCAPGEPVERRHVGIALDMLSKMEVVGTRERFDEFSAICRGMFGFDLVGQTRPERYPMVAELSEVLMRITSAVDLLEHDLAVYEFVVDALTGTAEAS